MQRQKKEEDKVEKVLAYIGIAIALFIFVAWAKYEYDKMWEGPKPQIQWFELDDSISAYSIMEEFVKDRLKSPAAANFPNIFQEGKEHITRLENQTYRIISYVDSQNSFGAVLRTAFIGEVRQVSKGKWELLSLNFIN